MHARKYTDLVSSSEPKPSRDHMDAILAQWRRERPDVDLTALGIMGRLFRAAQLADAELANGIAAHELRPGWFDLLAALRRAGRPFELNPTQLMATTMLSSGGMTKRLDRLEDAGLVERRADPSDRRGTMVGLTKKGQGLVDAALLTHVGNEERLLQPLTASERLTLDALLRKLLIRLEGG
jgi:DNA-binding MarR family transcriptional regulator